MAVDFKISKENKEADITVILKYITIFPQLSDHQFHYQGQAAGLIEPIDERVRAHIKKLVRGGVRWKTVILSRTNEYVSNELFSAESVPCRLRRRFKPDAITIRNIIASDKYETRHSKFHQENMMEFKKWWMPI